MSKMKNKNTYLVMRTANLDGGFTAETPKMRGRGDCRKC